MSSIHWLQSSREADYSRPSIILLCLSGLLGLNLNWPFLITSLSTYLRFAVS